MSSNLDRNADVAFVLYLVPFIANLVYALYLWASNGLSPILPQPVFLEAAQSPYLFLVGFGAVILGAMLDIIREVHVRGREALLAVSGRVQAIAVMAIVLASIAAWYAAGFDIGGALLNLLDGRYPLVFPALLILFSFLILPAVRLERVRSQDFIVIILLLATPLAIYEIGKRSPVAGIATGLVLIVIAAGLLLRRRSS